MSTYYLGSTESWEEYLKAVSQIQEIKGEIRKSSRAERIVISKQTQEIVASREALVKKFGEGFDAVNGTLDKGFGRLEKVIRETQSSIEDLRASFDYNMALVLEQLQLQNETSLHILNKLEDIHSVLENPLLTQARELFRIGCERLIKGLLDKALEAFLKSAAKDDANFLTQLMIGKLYLYGINRDNNVINLDKAEKHLSAAARYAKAESRLLPEANRFAGEAFLHSAISCYAQANMHLRNGNHQEAQRLLRKAYETAREASEVYPRLSESHYHQAKFAALLGNGKSASQSLGKAIELDETYCLKADADQDFKYVRKDITHLFYQLRDKSKSKIQQRLFHCEKLLSDWHFPSIEAKNAKLEIQQLLDEAENCLERNTYFDNQDALQLVQQAEQIFQSLLVHRFSLHTLSAHAGRVSCMAFNSLQNLFASGGTDKNIHIWRLPENQLLFALKGHQDVLTKLTFSHDGQALASVDKKGFVKVWNALEGTLLYDFEAKNGLVHCIAFSPDDSLLAVGNYDRVATLWSMDDGALRYTLRGHKSSVDTLVFSRDGKFLATGSPDNTAVVWQVEKGNLQHTFYGCSGLSHSLAFSTDNALLISGSNDGSVRFFKVGDGSLVHTLPARPGAISWLALSPDCKILATISFGKALQLWDVDSGKLIHNLKPFSPGVSSLRFSPDGTILAASDFKDHSVKLWNVQNGKLMHVIAGNLTCSCFSPDGTMLATGDEAGSIKFWGRMIKPQHPIGGTKSKSISQVRSWQKKAEMQELKRIRKTARARRNRLEPKAKQELPPPADFARQQELIPQQRPDAEKQKTFDGQGFQGKSELNPKIIQQRIQNGQCWVCGRKVGILAKLAGIKLCHKHYFHF